MSIFVIRVEDVGHSMVHQRGQYLWQDDDLFTDSSSSAHLFDAYDTREHAEAVAEDAMQRNRGLKLRIVEFYERGPAFNTEQQTVRTLYPLGGNGSGTEGC